MSLQMLFNILILTPYTNILNTHSNFFHYSIQDSEVKIDFSKNCLLKIDLDAYILNKQNLEEY
jgi:hypothetical protein